MSCSKVLSSTIEKVSKDTVMGETKAVQIATALARDYIHFKTGYSNEESEPLNKIARTLRRVAQELESKHGILFSTMCEKLDIHVSTAYGTFHKVATEMFEGGVNWGRIVALYAFGGKFSQYCVQNGMDILVVKIIEWIGVLVGGFSGWIEKAGGWDAFYEKFKDQNSEAEKFWWNTVLCATLGLGSLAAIVYTNTVS